MILVASLNKDKVKVYNDDNYKYMDNFCNLSEIKDSNNILILRNINVKKDGILKKYDYFLEEIFISLNIDLVISNKKNKKLIEICKYYKIPVVFL